MFIDIANATFCCMIYQVKTIKSNFVRIFDRNVYTLPFVFGESCYSSLKPFQIHAEKLGFIIFWFLLAGNQSKYNGGLDW